MSADHYFPDSFPCDAEPPNQDQPPPRFPVAAGGAGCDDARRGRGGDVGEEFPPFSLPQSRCDAYTSAYNSALQNDLLRKKACHPSGVVRWETERYLMFSGEDVHPAKRQTTRNLVRGAGLSSGPFS